MKAIIKDIEYYLPSKILTNKELAKNHPNWPAEKIAAKTGITKRHIASKEECSSDRGVKAARKLFATGICDSNQIDYLLFCTQSPDYFLPTTACIIQERLNIPISSGAIDFNLGCSGYIYGLGLAKGLIETEQAKNVLLVTSETYSKFTHPDDMSARSLFSDASAATLIKCEKSKDKGSSFIGPFIYGTDGRGAENLIVPQGPFRLHKNKKLKNSTADQARNFRTAKNLYMNGSEIFTFTLIAVPSAIKKLLSKANLSLEDIDLFVFHQANKFMLEHLRKKMAIPKEKFYINYQKIGNTVSSTIPIALKDAINEGRLQTGNLVMLVGFGVGYSWGATIVKWE